MTVLFIVLPLALAFSLLAVAGFIWAAKRGQFDDLTTPAHRILHDDAIVRPRPGRARH